MTAFSGAAKKNIRERLEKAYDLTDTDEGGDLDKYLELLFYDHAENERLDLIEKLLDILHRQRNDAEDRLEDGVARRIPRMEWMAEGEIQALSTVIDKLGQLSSAIEQRASTQWIAADRAASKRESENEAAERRARKRYLK